MDHKWPGERSGEDEAGQPMSWLKVPFLESSTCGRSLGLSGPGRRLNHLRRLFHAEVEFNIQEFSELRLIPLLWWGAVLVIYRGLRSLKTIQGGRPVHRMRGGINRASSRSMALWLGWDPITVATQRQAKRPRPKTDDKWRLRPTIKLMNDKFTGASCGVTPGWPLQFLTAPLAIRALLIP